MTMPPGSFLGSTSSTITDDGVNEFHTIICPTTVQPGDVLLFIAASDFFLVNTTDLDTARLPSGWSSLGVVTDGVFGACINVVRKTATVSESGTYKFFLKGTGTRSWGVLAAFRGLDANAAVVGALAMTTQGGGTAFTCPSQTLTTYSDLYLGIAFASAGVTFTPPATSRELVDAQISSIGVTRSFEIFVVQPEVTGATGTKISTASGAASGIAASIALAATAPRLATMLFPTTKGALGLATIGV
jgi:hypothetical protein